MSTLPENIRPTSENETRSAKAKHWVFTLNNWTEEDKNTIQTSFDEKSKNISYIVYKPEICPTTNTRHLQGLICFNDRVRWKQARECFKRSNGTINVWLHTMRGTINQAEAYVCKDDTADTANGPITRLGIRPSGQGSRTDCADIVNAIMSGQTELEIFESSPEFYLKHPNGVKRAIQIRQPKRDFKTKVYWFYGASGSGKSQKAFEIAGLNAYYKNASMEFWENYCNEDMVIIDDYRPSMCQFSEFLRILDRYPHLVNVKGNFSQFNSKYIFITSPKSPRETWKNQNEEDLYQLERRITQTVHFQRGQVPWSEEKQTEFVFDPDEIHIDRPPPAGLEHLAPLAPCFTSIESIKRQKQEIQSVTD